MSDIVASRHEYRLDLNARLAVTSTRLLTGANLQPLRPADLVALAELMLDAYRGTVDYEGESLAEAIREVESYFSPAAEDPALLGPSVMVVDGSTPLCASLVKFWRHRGCPLVGYVICQAEHKAQGLATFALNETLRLLQQMKYEEVRAVITEGNVPSERLFLAAGFKKV